MTRERALTQIYGVCAWVLPPFSSPQPPNPATRNQHWLTENAAYEALSAASKTTSRSAAHLNCRRGHNVQTPADCCMLCLVHRGICIRIFTSNVASYTTTVIRLAAWSAWVEDQLWGTPRQSGEFRCTVIAVLFFQPSWCLILVFYCNFRTIWLFFFFFFLAKMSKMNVGFKTKLKLKRLFLEC